MKILKTKRGTKASMQKKLESLRRGKKSEGSAREYTLRIHTLVNQEYLTMEDVAEFLLRAFSEEDIKQAYKWMEQDELIPTESQLTDAGLEFNDDGDLVSLDRDESYRRARRAPRRIHEQRARRAKKAMEFKNNSGTIEVLIGSNTTGYNTHEENLLFINALRSALEDEYSNANISVEMSRNISSTVLASGFDDIDDVEANVNLIKNQVWDKMEY